MNISDAAVEAAGAAFIDASLDPKRRNGDGPMRAALAAALPHLTTPAHPPCAIPQGERDEVAKVIADAAVDVNDDSSITIPEHWPERCADAVLAYLAKRAGADGGKTS